LDGKVFRTDRCARTTIRVKGKTINSWYSGMHRRFGGKRASDHAPELGGGRVLGPDNPTQNALLRSTRCLGERGFALLTGRWRAPHSITASPSRIGDYVEAALVLTHIEQPGARSSC
jgi:hypothetical protein